MVCTSLHVVVNPEFSDLEVCAAVCVQGGKAGWAPGEKSVDGPGDKYMLQVRGTSTHDTKAVQVSVSVLPPFNTVFSWC